MTAAPRTQAPSPRACVPHGQSAAIPQELRNRRQWVVWRRENGTKVPYNTTNGHKASTTNAQTWTSYDRACEAYTGALGTDSEYAGVGYVFSADDPYTGIDLDKCIDDAGEIAPWAREIVDAMQTYTEVSPSGHGLKLWVRGTVPSAVKTKHIEVYSRGRYFTVTGNHLPGTPRTIRSVDVELTALIQRVRPAREAAHTAAGGTINTSGDRPLAAIDWGKVDRWLGNLDILLTPEGIPRRVQYHPCSQVYKILTGKQAWPKADSAANDPSRIRYHVALGLYRFFGYEFEPLAAMLLHWGNFEHLGTESGKGSREIRTDIAAVLAIAVREYPDVKPTPIGDKPTKPAQPAPEVPRKSRGRPRTRPIDSFYQALVDEADCGKVMQTQPQLAARFRVSVPTIGRWEKELAGKVKRHRTADKQASYLEILRPIINAPAPERAHAAAADEAPEVLSKIPERSIDARTHEGKHTSLDQTPEAPSPDPEPQAAAATFPALADAMREAFAAYHDAGRITQRRIVEYLAANYPGAPWSDGALCYWYGVELARRQRERQRAQQLAKLPSMTQKELTKRERWCARLLEEGPDGPSGAKYYMARWLAPHVADELQRPERLAALERVKPGRGRRPAPAPKLTPVDATLPLLALVDEPQETLQPAQDGPSVASAVEPPWTPGTPMDARGEPPGAPELQDAIEARAPLAAVCSPNPAGLTVPMVPEPAREVIPAAASYVRPYVPPGGWTEATIAALPGVAHGGFAPDDPWIALQREIAGKAAALSA